MQEGDTATQTVTLNNNSLLNISNIFFKDALSAGTTFVADGGIRRGEKVDSLLPPRISGCGLPEKSFLRVWNFCGDLGGAFLLPVFLKRSRALPRLSVLRIKDFIRAARERMVFKIGMMLKKRKGRMENDKQKGIFCAIMKKNGKEKEFFV